MMAICVLTVLVLSSLTSVELQSSSNARKANIAKQNALLALNLAVGRLQETVGQDQRFTATAGIQGSTPNPYITGVWKKNVSEPSTWLISGNSDRSPKDATPANIPNPTGAKGTSEVFLVDLGSVSDESERVKLNKMDVADATNRGRYAYWIGDEGTKVSVAIEDETNSLNYNNSRPADADPNNPPGDGHNWTLKSYRDELRQIAPAVTNFWILAGIPFADVSSSNRIGNVSQLGHLPMLASGGTSPDPKDFFHTMTPLSRGVLIDHTAKNGKLKEDLSDTPSFSGSQTGVKRFLRARLDTLSDGNRGFFTQTSRNRTDGIFPQFSIGPVLTEFVVRYGFYREVTGPKEDGSEQDDELRIRTEMQVELWNPYAFDVEIESRMEITVKNLPDIELTIDGKTYTVNIPDDIFLRGPSLAYDTPAYAASPCVFAPGEIKWLKGSGGLGGRLLSTTGSSRSEAIPDRTGGAPTTDPSKLPPIKIPPLDPLAVSEAEIRIVVPELDGEDDNFLLVEIDSAGHLLSSFQPQFTYSKVDITVPLSQSDWRFGYAFEMDDDLERWTYGDHPKAMDPRNFDMDKTDFADESFQYWTNDPTDTLGTINQAGGGSFNSLKSIILFDVPTQEPVSVGTLTNLIGEKPYMLGNTWGSSVNDYFDKYFISTIPRWFDWDLSNPPILPSRYIDFYLEGQPNIVIGDPYGRSDVDADYVLDSKHAAKYVMSKGSFNINSVSVDAWTSLLAGINIGNWETEDGTIIQLSHAYFRQSFNAREVPNSPMEEIEKSTAFDRSGVSLTLPQIRSLARAVVNIILARGHPYESVSEFVNDGVFAQAIEDAEINQRIESFNLPENSPAELTQADLIKPIAPMLTPRSDTFLIRSYGGFEEFGGSTEAEVWCEAVVQRVPSLTDPVSGSGPIDYKRDPLSPSTSRFPFGREFKVISFRFLGKDEV